MVTETAHATTPAPRKKIRAQNANIFLLVVTSGLVLTLVVSASLYIFIERSVKAIQIQQQAETVQMVKSRVARIDLNMDWATFLLRAGPKSDNFSEYFDTQARSGVSVPFSYLFWWSEGVAAEVDRAVLYQRDPSGTHLLAALEDELQDDLAALKNVGNKTTVMLPIRRVLPATQVHQPFEKTFLRVKSTPVALVRVLVSPAGVKSYLVAVVPADNFVDSPWVEARGYVGRLILRNKAREDSLLTDVFPIYLPSDPDPVDDDQGIVLPLSGVGPWASKIQITLSIENSRQVILLRAIPEFALFFCLLVTIMGGVYVRSNQKQAAILTKMNRTLAIKNMEMNSQVIERERLNQVLRKTERENRAIIDSVSDIIFEVDQDGYITFINDTWHRVLGYPVEQSVGLNLFELMERNEQDKNRRTYQDLLLGKKGAYNVSVHLLSASSSYRLVEIYYSMIRMDENNNPRVVGTIVDIQDRHVAAEAMAEAEKKYRNIWENVVSGIYQVTTDGELLSANPAMAHIFGYDTPERMVLEVTHMSRQLYASLKDRQAMLRDLMDKGQLSNIESEGVRRDKTHFWMRESIRVVKNDKGEVLYYEGSIDDITISKEAEMKLHNAVTQSEIANRSKTEFLANMSHELRTPLNAIIGFSEIIKDEVFGKLAQPQYLEYARDIHESGRNLLSIINTILDVARIEGGERQLNETILDLPKLIDSVVALVKSRADVNEQQISLKAIDMLPNLLGDELAVKQILLNLMTNAIKFTPTGGTITVSGDIEKSGNLRVSVTDTGVGLDEEEIARVMAPFGQASGQFSRSSSGPGLGLTLVNSLVRIHGGRFDMVSQKGVGTTASVIFPSSRIRVN